MFKPFFPPSLPPSPYSQASFAAGTIARIPTSICNNQKECSTQDSRKPRATSMCVRGMESKAPPVVTPAVHQAPV